MNHWPNIFVLFCYLHYGPQTILCYFFSLDFTNRSDYWWLGFRVSPKLSFTHVRDWLIGPVQIYGPNCILKNNSNIIFRVNYTLVPCGLTLFHFGTLWFETWHFGTLWYSPLTLWYPLELFCNFNHDKFCKNYILTPKSF